MGQSPTSSCQPFLINKANGINDMVAPEKLQEGFSQAEINYISSGDVRGRRQGRDLYYLIDEQAVSSIHSVSWSNGISNLIAQFGTNFWDITPTFSYYFRNNSRLILQAPGGQYWNCTPGFSTGLIFPTVVSTPSTAVQAASLTVTNQQTIAFQVSGGAIQLLADFQHDNSWYLESQLDQLGFTQFTSDLVYTYASGFSLIIQDSASNSLKFQVANDGTFYTITA